MAHSVDHVMVPRSHGLFPYTLARVLVMDTDTETQRSALVASQLKDMVEYAAMVDALHTFTATPDVRRTLVSLGEVHQNTTRLALGERSPGVDTG